MNAPRTLLTYAVGDRTVYMASHDTEWTRVVRCQMRGCGKRFRGPRHIWDDLQAMYQRVRRHARSHA